MFDKLTGVVPDIDLVLSILLQSSIPACRAASTSTQPVANPASSMNQNGSVNRMGKRKDRESNLSSLSKFLYLPLYCNQIFFYFGELVFTVECNLGHFHEMNKIYAEKYALVVPS